MDRELLSGFVFKLPDPTSELKIGRWVSSCEATVRLRDGASWQSPSRVVKQRSELLKTQEMQSGEVPVVREKRDIHAGRTNGRDKHLKEEPTHPHHQRWPGCVTIGPQVMRGWQREGSIAGFRTLEGWVAFWQGPPDSPARKRASLLS